MRDEAAVDYTPNTHGCLTPLSAVYRGYADQNLLVEDEFHYSPFKMFEADADIQFKPLPETNPK